MKAIPGTLQEGGAGFQTTHWTLVLRARETQSDTSSQKALSNFCEAYWPPLYAFLRHRGHASPEAQVPVQRIRSRARLKTRRRTPDCFNRRASAGSRSVDDGHHAPQRFGYL